METKVRKFVPQFKVADMISMIGIGFTGVAVGAYLHEHFVGIIQVLAVIGLLLLSIGMYGKYQIERQHIDPPGWVIAVFTLCWIGLVMAGLYILIGKFIVTGI